MLFFVLHLYNDLVFEGKPVSLGLITNRGLVEQVPFHFTSVIIPVGTTEHK